VINNNACAYDKCHHKRKGVYSCNCNILSLKVQPCAVAQEMQRNATQVMAWDIKTLTWPETSCLIKNNPGFLG